MNSMTGFGRAEISRKDYRLSVEISSVNGRFLELIFRMPRSLTGLEAKIKDVLSKKIARGKVTVTVFLEESAVAVSKSLIDYNLARGYHKQLVKLRKNLRLAGEITIADIVSNPMFMVSPNDRIREAKVWPDLKKLIFRAMGDLHRMRQLEGRNLGKDMSRRLRLIGRHVAKIEKQAPRNVIEHRKKFLKRVTELGEGMEIDPARLAEEITIYADRSDLTEECVRLRSHLDMFASAMKSRSDIGKKLNFILQEMGREANTISSKSLSSNISSHAIEMKEEIEKLREQVQNIE